MDSEYDDELNIDPRETDHPYDLEQEVNFYGLKMKLAELGYTDPVLVNELRNKFMESEQPVFSVGHKEIVDGQQLRVWFEFRRDAGREYQLAQYEALLFQRDNDGAHRLFDQSISREQAISVLRQDQNRLSLDVNEPSPMTSQQVRAYLQQPYGSEEKIAQAIAGLKVCGLYDPTMPERLFAHLEKNDPYAEFGMERDIAGVKRLITLELYITDEKALKFSRYNVWVKRQSRPFEQLTSNGVDSNSLDAKMSAIDWNKHPGREITEADTVNSPVMKAMQEVLTDMDRFYGNNFYERAEEYQFLIRKALGELYVKHFTGTPMEKLHLENPHLRSIYFQQHPFRPEVHIDQLTNIINNPIVLNRLSYGPLPQAGKKIKKDITMDKQQIFFELRGELENLGFRDTAVLDEVRKAIYNGDLMKRIPVTEGSTRFELDFAHDDAGRLGLFNYAGNYLDERTQKWQLQNFDPEVPKADAVALLEARAKHAPNELHDSFSPIFLKDVHREINSLNQNVMNTENLSYLHKQLLNLGFGEQVNADLEKQISQKNKEFTLNAKHDFGGRNVDYQLHFRAGDSADMYFFNKYDATVKNSSDAEKDKSQTFYINKGNGVTAKEAFNLIEGRSVHKQLFNLEGEKYQAWLHLDKTPQEDGNRKIHTYHENYGYDVEKVLKGKGIKEMDNTQSKDDLLRSLKKGNAQQITVSKDGHDQKYFISANPQFKTVDLYDEHMKKIKRETLLSPDGKTQSNRQAQKNKQSEEGVPAKKQNRGAKMKA